LLILNKVKIFNQTILLKLSSIGTLIEKDGRGKEVKRRRGDQAKERRRDEDGEAISQNNRLAK